jgi:type VI secretion system protein ImpB
MDGKDGAQELLDKVLKDPALMKALAAAKPAEQVEEGATAEGQA